MNEGKISAGKVEVKTKCVGIVGYEVRALGKWDPENIKGGIAGSEEAIIYGSDALRRLGHKVIVFADPPEDSKWRLESSNPRFLPESALSQFTAEEFDILLFWRRCDFFTVVNSRMKSLRDENNKEGRVEKRKRPKILFWPHDVCTFRIPFEQINILDGVGNVVSSGAISGAIFQSILNDGLSVDIRKSLLRGVMGAIDECDLRRASREAMSMGWRIGESPWQCKLSDVDSANIFGMLDWKTLLVVETVCRAWLFSSRYAGLGWHSLIIENRKTEERKTEKDKETKALKKSKGSSFDNIKKLTGYQRLKRVTTFHLFYTPSTDTISCLLREMPSLTSLNILALKSLPIFKCPLQKLSCVIIKGRSELELDRCLRSVKTSLHTLEIRDLHSVHESILQLTNLTSLSLPHTPFTCKVADKLQRLPLRHLSLSTQEVGPAEKLKLPSTLESLDIHQNTSHGWFILPILAKECPTLLTLRIDTALGSKSTADIAAFLINFPSLTTLDLLSSIWISTYGILKRFTQLTHLTLCKKYTDVHTHWLSPLCEMPLLKVLHLDSTYIINSRDNAELLSSMLPLEELIVTVSMDMISHFELSSVHTLHLHIVNVVADEKQTPLSITMLPTRLKALQRAHIRLELPLLTETDIACWKATFPLFTEYPSWLTSLVCVYDSKKSASLHWTIITTLIALENQMRTTRPHPISFFDPSTFNFTLFSQPPPLE